MRYKICLPILLLLSACTQVSNHDLASGKQNVWGGGFLVEEVEKDRYHILAKTNWGPYPNYSAARKMWRLQAEKVCGVGDFEEEEIKEQVYNTMPSTGSYLVTEKSGVAVCLSGSKLDDKPAVIGK